MRADLGENVDISLADILHCCYPVTVCIEQKISPYKLS
jgi:hypothetical protein